MGASADEAAAVAAFSFSCICLNRSMKEPSLAKSPLSMGSALVLLQPSLAASHNYNSFKLQLTQHRRLTKIQQSSLSPRSDTSKIINSRECPESKAFAKLRRGNLRRKGLVSMRMGSNRGIRSNPGRVDGEFTWYSRKGSEGSIWGIGAVQESER